MASLAPVEFEFVPPPEAPVFRPTPEEFADPLAYINKIRPVAEQTGICRIVPPQDWQPPFAVDIDNLKFTPRIQRLNELEAHTRVKLNFLDQIAKFWELQGSSLKIPLVEAQALDLYTLHREVNRQGGLVAVTSSRLWGKIAQRMGFTGAKNQLAMTLKQHYERVLLPFDIFQAEKAVQDEPQASTSGESSAKTELLKSETADAVEETGPAVRRPSRLQQQPSLDHDTVHEMAEQAGGHSKELKRLQFYGAGPKMSGYQEGTKAKPRPKKEHYELDPLARYVCHCCARGDSEEAMLLCDGCDDSYHTFCLNPPLAEIPKGDWRCPRCVATEVDKPQEPFGFEQAQKQYTLQTFGEMADQFKSDYFNMPVHLVPCEAVEREYWRIVSTIDEDVIVEYGADLHTMDHGSGFPTRDSKDLSADDEQYVTSGWNLNNIAVQDNSILAHIKANISGMKVPWMYVGMCFSTFCWHTEDHWSYSINYLHWGEPKTWYGCSGRRADQFEDAMRSSAPDLFRVQPDLLHQLVTTMNPNILMAAGVPIFRTDQQAGDFVVTFPRAYHSGFNHGFNLAEAVNFTPPDWMAMGRECVQHYSNLRRFCVFSHDELACTMALQPDRLSLLVASATYQDLLKLIDLERHARARLLEKGVRKAEREAFELLPDDERQCDFCKTTCFLSALTCPCNKKLVCLRHQDKLCGCLPSNHILRFRYTLHELPEMLRRLRERVESFDQWILKVKNGLVATGDARLGIEDLKSLLEEAQAKRFPESDLIKSLALVIEEASKCSTVAQQLTGQKVRTRTRQQCESRFRLSVDELQLFYEHVTQLACRIPDENKLKQLVDQVVEFQRKAVRLMEPEMPPPSAEVQACVDLGTEIDIALPELVELKQRLSHSLWLEEVDSGLTGQRRLQLNDVVRLVESGMTLPPYRVVERAMTELQTLLLTGQQHEQHAKQALEDSPWRSMAELERLVKAADKLPVQLPSVDAVREVVSKAADWIEKVSAFGDKDKPQLELVEVMLSRGRALPVELQDLGRLEALVVAASAWKDRAERVFFRRNLYLTLLEILSPRADTRIYQTRRRRRRLKEDSSTASGSSTGALLTSGASMAQLVQLYNEAETRELELMRELRAAHRRKRDTESDTGSFCLCRRPAQGYMLQCELCWDLFHLSCVPPGAKLAINRTRPTASELQFTKFLCPLCTRSRRPRLDAVLGLLVGLQKIGVRLPEGVALHCLTERAMRWQDRARSLLSSDQLSAALVRLANSSHCPQGVAADKTTTKVVADPSTDDVTAGSEDSSRPRPSTSMSDDEDPATGFSATEHTYSFGGSRDSQQPATSSTRKPRKSLLAPRQGVSPPPPAPLGSAVPVRPLLAADWVGRLEDLMLEADLLEVTSDEAADLWRLIASARPPVKHDYFSEGDKTVPERPARSKLPGSLRKRRSQAGAPGSSGAAAAAVLKRLKVKVKPDQRRDELTPSSQSESSPGSSPTKPRAKSLAAAFRRKAVLKDRPRTGEKVMKPRKHLESSGGPAGSLEAAGDQEGGTEGHYSEDCAARPCQKPHGTCINWIGCDRCEQWYHYICVGLPRNYRVTEDMVYICPQCQDQPSPTAVPVESQQDAAGCVSGGGREGQLTTSVSQSGASLLDLAAAAAHLQQGGADTLGDGSGSTQPLQQQDVFVKQEMDTAEPDSPPALVIADSSTEE